VPCTTPGCRGTIVWPAGVVFGGDVVRRELAREIETSLRRHLDCPALDLRISKPARDA